LHHRRPLLNGQRLAAAPEVGVFVEVQSDLVSALLPIGEQSQTRLRRHARERRLRLHGQFSAVLLDQVRQQA